VNVALRRGDLVEVRSQAEILATLDERCMLDGLPFMPEMLQYCGHRFRVAARADKICSTMYAGSQELPAAVLLEDLRCDGSEHDGCQTGCRIFWKEVWLRRLEPEELALSTPDSNAADTALVSVAKRWASYAAPDGTARYVCQATESHRASRPLRTVDPRPYIHQLRSGNVDIFRFTRLMLRALVQEFSLRIGVRDTRPLRGSRTEPLDTPRLDLHPGDLVRVKSKEQILETLSPEGSDRAVAFDDENMPFCGGTYQVYRRVNHMIDEFTGRMMDLEHEWYMLDDVVCSGEHAPGRWFCPRGFHVQWTDAWIEPSGGPDRRP
jgi:hypothetical protein